MEDYENLNWVRVQKKTFTRWCNTYLLERRLKVEDLSADLADGKCLISLLEQISSKTVAHTYNKNPKIRVQKIENVNFSLEFLKNEGIKLVGVGGGDIVDGNLKLILGLIWTIILRYQIQVAEGNSARADLLEWVRQRIPEYNIHNFAGDWASGRAICALTEAVQPGQMNLPHDFKPDPTANAHMGMTKAEQNMNIPMILDAEDMANAPDELANMTYISYFRDYWNSMMEKMAWPENSPSCLSLPTFKLQVGMAKSRHKEGTLFRLLLMDPLDRFLPRFSTTATVLTMSPTNFLLPDSTPFL